MNNTLHILPRDAFLCRPLTVSRVYIHQSIIYLYAYVFLILSLCLSLYKLIHIQFIYPTSRKVPCRRAYGRIVHTQIYSAIFDIYIPIEYMFVQYIYIYVYMYIYVCI